MKVGVIILNWNGKKDTLECLSTVATTKSDKHEFVIYVVDNASSDDSVDVFKKKYPDCTYIVTQKNLGYAGGNNVGIEAALADGCDAVILLNNDTTVQSTTFDRLVSGAIKHKFDLAAPKIYFYPGNEFHLKQYKKSELGKVIWFAGGRMDWANIIPHHIGVDEVDHGQWEKPSETEFATGCCLYINKRVLKKLGGLDATYTAYFEDNDYCMKARKQGFIIGYIPQAKMWHKNASSSGGSGSKKQVGVVDRSRFIFAMRYASWRAKLAIIRNKLQGNQF